MTVVIYTDGACKVEKIPKYVPGQPTDPRPEALGMGGWAWWINKQLWDSGAVERTTNNRMEMLAVIEALETMKIERPTKRLLIVSDSAYVVNCFNDHWYDKWLDNNWRNSAGAEVKNRDLWEQMLDLYFGHDNAIQFRHCRGHGRGGIEDAPYVHGNDNADKLAVAARLLLEKKR